MKSQCTRCGKWIRYDGLHAMGTDAFCSCRRGASGYLSDSPPDVVFIN